MATKRDLLARWTREPGQAILQRINEFCFQLQWPGHGRSSEELFALLEGLPYRDEVPNGRDLRGAPLSGGVHELDFRECDFSYAPLDMNFVNCDFTAARFDEATSTGLILKTLNRASFRRARLRGCYLAKAEARECSFERAVLTGANFEGADLSGSSFRDASCKRAKFLGATLLGCDFRGAVLDEAVFQGVRLDKSTDLRGASLINLYHRDHRDVAGNLVAPGTDWRQATYSVTTIFGDDPAATAREILDAAVATLGQPADQRTARLRDALEDLRRQLQGKYRASWYEDLLARFDEADRPFVEGVLTRAAESLR